MRVKWDEAMKSRLIILSAAICATLATASQAAAQEDTSILAFDALSCHDWNSPSVLTTKQSLQNWTLNFLSGLVATSGYREDAAPQITPAQAFPWIDDYCQRRPLDGLSTAGLELLNDLSQHPKAPN
jgi:hypothetical protein